jgi:hypothetical protein
MGRNGRGEGGGEWLNVRLQRCDLGEMSASGVAFFGGLDLAGDGGIGIGCWELAIFDERVVEN